MWSLFGLQTLPLARLVLARLLAERCFYALDHDRVRFRDITGRCAVASAGAAPPLEAQHGSWWPCLDSQIKGRRCKAIISVSEWATGDDMLTLREMSEVDLPIFFEYQQEPDAKRMAAFPEIERDAFMAHWREQVLGNVRVQKKTIVVDNNVAGNVVSWEQSGQRLVGYWVGQAYWGRGIATAALADGTKGSSGNEEQVFRLDG